MDCSVMKDHINSILAVIYLNKDQKTFISYGHD
jgi:hypothetical protein